MVATLTINLVTILQATAPALEFDDDMVCTQQSAQDTLLSVEQLRTFYLNERLEIVDDLILGFVQVGES